MVRDCQLGPAIPLVGSLREGSLGLDFAILLDVNVFAGLEDADVVIRVFDTVPGTESVQMAVEACGGGHT